MKNITDKSIDMILCDLPYGQTARNKWDNVIPMNDYIILNNKIYTFNDYLLYCYENNIKLEDATEYFDNNKYIGLWNSYKRIIKDNGAIVLFGQGIFTADLINSNKEMWRYNLIWQKTQPSGFFNAKKMPLRAHEDIIVFYKSLPTYNPQKTTGHPRKVSKAQHKTNCKQSTNYGLTEFSSYDSTERYPISVMVYAKDTQKSALHPTQKPVALLEYLIKTYTNENDIVLDNCMGSGSTAVACLNANRNFIGIEKDKEIFEIAKERIELLNNELFIA